MIECIVCENKKKFKSKFEILLECLDCGHIFADINIDFNETKKIYSDNYFFGEEYIDYINDRNAIEKNAKLRNIIIKKHTKKINPKNLYEIGCAYGFFLNKVRQDYNLINGIDVNSNAIRYANQYLKLKLDEGNFLKKNIIKNNYNIFCLFDVIEHLPHPNSFIKKISDISQNGSYLFITTGDIKSLNARIKGKNWRLIHPPTHIHYFSKLSIAALLNKYNFDVVDIKYIGNYRNLKFILNKIILFSKNSKLLNSLIKFLNLDKIDVYLNLFDIMFVIAKKNEK